MELAGEKNLTPFTGTPVRNTDNRIPETENAIRGVQADYMMLNANVPITAAKMTARAAARITQIDR